MMRLKALRWDLVYAKSTLIQRKLENANLLSLFLNVLLESPTLKYNIFLSFSTFSLMAIHNH